MNKKYLMSAISALIMILLGFSAAAAVTVTYSFYDIHTAQPLSNVDVLGYPCNDAACSSLRLNQPLAGTGNSGTASALNIVFPTNLVTPYGYAVYYFRPGYAPQEYNADWRGTGSTSYSIPFNKILDCHSDINQLSVNEQNGDYIVEAAVESAFSDTANGVAYVPPAYTDYYSSDVSIRITVFDEDGIVAAQNTLSRNIYMGSSAAVSLNAGDLAPGNYTAVVRTDVTDNQCHNDIELSQSIEFEVEKTGPEPLVVTLTAVPSSGPEPLDVLFTCSVQGGDSPYQYRLDDDGSLFFTFNSSNTGINANRQFSQGVYNITCTVTDDNGASGSDSVIINATGQVPSYECSDGTDNDGDGSIDWPADPGCTGPNDDNETDPVTYPECSDSIDNDGDGSIDWPADPGCTGPSDDDETDSIVCENHLSISNVNMEGTDLIEGLTYLVPGSSLSNGYIAFDYDFTNNGSTAVLVANYTVTMAGQAQESSVIPVIAAGTTFVEGNDFSLPSGLPDGLYNMSIVITGVDADICSQYDSFTFLARVNTTAPSYECSDGIDNDGDGLVDAQDPGCYDSGAYNPLDDDETDTLPECSDHFDNDGDGLIDWPADPGCASTSDDNETDPAGSDDAPLVVLLFPANNSAFTIGDIIFIYGVTDDNAPVLQCTLYTNVTGSFVAEQTQWTPNGNLGYFNVTGIPDGTYDWNVECSDGFNSAFAPDNWIFTINSTGYVDVPAVITSAAGEQESCSAPYAVQFTSSATGNSPLIYSWDFGDSSASNQQNPQHNYASEGTYTVTLTVTDADGDTDTHSFTVIVAECEDSGEDDHEEEDSEACELYIGRILMYSDIIDDYGEEHVRAGDELFVNVYFENQGDFDLDDVLFRALIPDIGVLNSVNFDLDVGDDTTRTVMLDIPSDTPAGNYDIQISAHNDCVSRTKYRLVTVVD